MTTPVPTKITNHNDVAIARLPSFEQGSANLSALYRALTTGIQDVEDVLDDMLNLRAISTGVGLQLDNVGTYLNLTRTIGQSDSSYAAALLAQAAALAADSGTMEQLLQLYQLLTLATNIYSDDIQPATFEMTAVAVDDGPIDADIIAAMTSGKAAGVQMLLQIAVSNEFLFGASSDTDVGGDLPADVDHGWGDDADADANGDIAPGTGKGGNWARLLT